MSFSFFWTPQQLQWFHLQQLQQQLHLFIKDGTPATYNTKWEDLHPHSQMILLQIEERILEYRDESQRLDQTIGFYKCSVSNDGFKSEASHIVQELDRISAAMERSRNLQQELMSSVKNMLRNTQKDVRTLLIQCPRFLHPSESRLSSQPAATLVPDFNHGLPEKPSSFLRQTISRFEKNLGDCCRWIEELEMLLKNSEKNNSNNGSVSLESLPKAMAKVHDIFIHVAAKVEKSIHQHMNNMKSTHRVKHRHWQEENELFRVADQCETARKEVSSERVSLSLPLPEDSQPQTELAAQLFSSSGTAGVSTGPQTYPLTSNSTGSGLSVSSTPSSVPSSSFPSLSMTPATSAPVFTLSESSTATFQTSLLNSSSETVFGSTPFQFGGTAPSCGPTSGGSASSTLFSIGSGTGSGGRSKTQSRRPKSKTRRR